MRGKLRVGKKLRVLIYQEEGYFVAQCLDYDVRVQAKTFTDVIRYFIFALNETYQDSLKQHGQAFAHINPAPDKFHEMWKNRIAALHLRSTTPRPEELAVSQEPALPLDLALAR